MKEKDTGYTADQAYNWKYIRDNLDTIPEYEKAVIEGYLLCKYTEKRCGCE